MNEYNWRKEKEKFQPDFNKVNKQENAPVPQLEPPKKSQWGKIISVILCVLALVLLAIFVVNISKQDSAQALARAAENNKNAVALVSCNIELNNGKKIIIPVGTAWAFNSNQWATNAHVVQGLKSVLARTQWQIAEMLASDLLKKAGTKNLKEFLSKQNKQRSESLIKDLQAKVAKEIKQVSASILINGERQKGYAITEFQIHKSYGVVGSSFEPDLAVLTIQDKVEDFFRIAGNKKLSALKSGMPVAFLGFPMENLEKDNVNIDYPIASMQSGIIVAVSGFDMKDAGMQNNYLIRHNLPLTGGASGSPIFDVDGEVIGVLFAMNTVGQIQKSDAGVEVARAPSGAMINFAIRVDLLKEMGAPVKVKDFLQ